MNTSAISIEIFTHRVTEMTKASVHNKQKVRDMNSMCKSTQFPLIHYSIPTALYSLLHQKRLHLS